MSRADIIIFTYQMRKAKFRGLKSLVQGHGQQIAKVGLEAKNNDSLLTCYSHYALLLPGLATEELGCIGFTLMLFLPSMAGIRNLGSD